MLQEGLIHETGSSWRGLFTKPEVVGGVLYTKPEVVGGGLYTKTGSSVDVHRFRLCCKRGLYTKPEVVGGAYSRNRK